MASPTQLISRNLPVGWRFRPTDEELLCNYLKPKILGDPIGGSDVEEDNLCDYDPWDLFGKFKSKYGDDKERYFLSPCEYYERSGLRKRKAKSGGYWKCTGDPRLITLGDSDEVIGTKRSLVYHNPNATDLIKTEYTYTAKLDRPILGNFVLYKLKRKSKKKQAPSKRAMKAKPHCRKTRPNKKARRDESSNSTASSLAFENKNTKDTIANAANGAEGKERNRMVSDIENQYPPNKKTASSTYEKGESSYPKASDVENQNLSETASALTSNKGETSSLMASSTGNQNFNQITIVSTNNKGDKSCTVVFDLENLIPNKITDTSLYDKSKPICPRASCVEIQNSHEMINVSSHNKDETTFLMDFDFEKQNPIEKITMLLHDKANACCLVTSDFGIQNPSKKMGISASIAGNWSPLTAMPSDFDNQNQYQKTDVPVPEEDYCIVMASEVGDTTIQEVQYQYNKTDMPNLEDYSGFLKASDIEETPYEEVQSHYKKANMPNLEDKEGPLIASDIEEAISLAVDPQQLAEMIACLDSVLQQPVHTNESPNRICFGMQDHYEKIDKPILNNGPLTGESMVTEVSNGILGVRAYFYRCEASEANLETYVYFIVILSADRPSTAGRDIRILRTKRHRELAAAAYSH
ncbi:transcription factor, putative [Ricinus communis]|uniref:Transcription factor, putative n=1 Tax=Ricinus communis TaxID=3988 RepID=B9RMX3_RICCO|nr:transcription factor, putative [Ricinus communis]